MFYHNLSDTDTILTRVSARLQQPQNTDRRRRYSKACCITVAFYSVFRYIVDRTACSKCKRCTYQLHPFSTSKDQGSSDKFPID